MAIIKGKPLHRLTLTLSDTFSSRLHEEAASRHETVAAYAKYLLLNGCFQQVVDALGHRIARLERSVASLDKDVSTLRAKTRKEE